MEQRPAGVRLIQWANTPLGEEVLEGLGGGLMAGLPLYLQDMDPGQATLAVAGAIAGGIGMGMAGRRIGAHVGRKIRPAPLENQQGMTAMAGRMLGQETLGEALEQTGSAMKGQVADYLVNNKATRMLDEGVMSSAEWEKLKGLRAVNSAKNSLLNMPEAMQESLAQSLNTDAATLRGLVESGKLPHLGPGQALDPQDIARLKELEDKLTRGAFDEIDDRLQRAAHSLETDPEMQEAIGAAGGLVTPGLLRNMAGGNLVPITGEHVGRAAGRFFGDEIGVFGGMGLGLMAGQQLGMQSPKDREIARLQEQLQQGVK